MIKIIKIIMIIIIMIIIIMIITALLLIMTTLMVHLYATTVLPSLLSAVNKVKSRILTQYIYTHMYVILTHPLQEDFKVTISVPISSQVNKCKLQRKRRRASAEPSHS